MVSILLLSGVVDASADPGTRPVPARASEMAATEVLLEYASGGQADNNPESAQWGLARQTEAIKMGDHGWLHSQDFSYIFWTATIDRCMHQNAQFVLDTVHDW